jgi:hypothetical protein
MSNVRDIINVSVKSKKLLQHKAFLVVVKFKLTISVRRKQFNV